jgi:hypothetical protein
MQIIAAPLALLCTMAATSTLASASSEYSRNFPAPATISGERAGVGFGSGGPRADANINTYPDWVKIDFNGANTIDRVVVYSIQDANFSAAEPSDTMTSAIYGAVDFTVQGWDGSAWVTLGTVIGNNLVKRAGSFPARSTDRIRVNITNALSGWSRLVEIEAWSAP